MLFANRNQPTSYIQDSIPSDLRSWRGKGQQLRQKMTDAPSRVMCLISVKPIEEQSSDEEKPTTVEDVQDNGVGDDMQDFIKERQPINEKSTT